MPPDSPRNQTNSRWMLFALLLGLYLSVRGYHSREGDQTYRLPLLLHYQNHAVYANDPFVRAFDVFNPHRVYLALLDATSRLMGLSAALAVLYALTFAVACIGLDRLARSTWPEAGPRVGVVAVGLMLLARAGNIATNHLFEPMLLDRGIGFALGWLALAMVVGQPERGRWTAMVVLGLAALIHPAVGFQLALLVAASWIIWSMQPSATGVSRRLALQGATLAALAVVPSLWLNAAQSSRLFEGLPADEFRLLAAYVQSPQHMLPHLWRRPQWLAWGCYFLLAGLSLFTRDRAAAGSSWPVARVRLAMLLLVNLAGLGLAWIAIEVMHDLRVTVFQPFRMATVARGLALILLASRVQALWNQNDFEGRLRAMLLALGLTGDWTLVAVTLVEVATTATGAVHAYLTSRPRASLTGCRPALLVGLAILAAGLAFLARHDTESGHERLLAGMAFLCAGALVQRARTRLALAPKRPTSRRIAWAMAAAWAVPLAALVAPLLPLSGSVAGRRLVESLEKRCRFAEVPVDDLERMAVWCRYHTPPGARFVGPPSPKTFRLWSRRSLAFNRAASPYHAAGLADWSARFRAHVGFQGTTAEFSRAYLADRQGLERRYQAFSDLELATLAARQDATYILAAAPGSASPPTRPSSALELLHVEGRYAVYKAGTVQKSGPLSLAGSQSAEKSVR